MKIIQIIHYRSNGGRQILICLNENGEIWHYDIDNATWMYMTSGPQAVDRP